MNMASICIRYHQSFHRHGEAVINWGNDAMSAFVEANHVSVTATVPSQYEGFFITRQRRPLGFFFNSLFLCKICSEDFQVLLYAKSVGIVLFHVLILCISFL